MFVRDYPNKNRGLLGSIKWLAFCYIIRYRSQNSFDEVGGEGGFFWRNCPNLPPGRQRHVGQRLGWLACSPFKKLSLFLIFNAENLTYMQIDPSSCMTPPLSKTTPYTSLCPKPNFGHSTMWIWYEPEFSNGGSRPSGHFSSRFAHGDSLIPFKLLI